jgi:hypothetical protein
VIDNPDGISNSRLRQLIETKHQRMADEIDRRISAQFDAVTAASIAFNPQVKPAVR